MRPSPVTRDQLVEAVWAEPPATVANAVHHYMAALRQVREPTRGGRAPGDLIVPRGSGYLLRPEARQVDTELADEHRAGSRRCRAAGDLTAAVGSLEAALSLYRATPLAGIPGPWAGLERVRLGEQRLTMFEERVEILLELGRARDATDELSTLVREHPLRERLRGQLMLALCRRGRQADALAVFADTRRLLIEELGIEPGLDLRRLHQRILAGDPAVLRPAAVATGAAT